jgi:hypothetical protein
MVMSTLCTGRLLARESLGSTAVYRVVGARDRLVDVEVIEAPGLARGARLRLTRAAAQGMRPLGDRSAAASGSRRPRLLRRLAAG